MKIGITFGGYAPLHQGHLDLIMKAKKENDFTCVVVCGYDNEERTEFLNLNLTAKTKLVKDFLEDDLVKVISVNDTELGLDESMSDENWRVWVRDCLNKALQTLPQFSPIEQITWYVGEASYKKPIINASKDYFEFFKLKIKVEVADRTKNAISGTECRNNPIKNWNKIAKPYRGLLSHNILISGTASEGKTTLVEDIAKYYGLVYSYEKGRDNCEWKSDTEFDAKDFIYNLYEQRHYNEELINSPANTGVFISDTDNLVTLMYAWKYSQRDNFALTEDNYKTLVDIAKIYKKSTKWSKIFLLAPHEKPIVDDGERYMPDSDYRIRVEYFEKLKSLYDEFGYEYEILNGTYYENFLKVKDYIGGLYK